MDATTIMTIDQLMCSDLADERVELIAGVVYRMTPAGGRHGLVCSNVLITLGQYVRERSLGALFTPDTGFLLRRAPDTLRCPDVAFVSTARLAEYGIGPGMMTAPPDLAVEILSPSNSARYMNDKIRDYFDAGVRLVWVIDPGARTVTRWAPGEAIRTALESDTIDGGEVVPGFVGPRTQDPEYTKTIADYNEQINRHPELITAIVPLRDGVAISVKKLH